MYMQNTHTDRGINKIIEITGGKFFGSLNTTQSHHPKKLLIFNSRFINNINEYSSLVESSLFALHVTAPESLTFGDFLINPIFESNITSVICNERYCHTVMSSKNQFIAASFKSIHVPESLTNNSAQAKYAFSSRV